MTDHLIGTWLVTCPPSDPEYAEGVDLYHVYSADGNYFTYAFVPDPKADAVLVTRGRWKREGQMLTTSVVETEVHFVGDTVPSAIEESNYQYGAWIKRVDHDELILLDEDGRTVRCVRRSLPGKFDFVL